MSTYTAHYLSVGKTRREHISLPDGRNTADNCPVGVKSERIAALKRIVRIEKLHLRLRRDKTPLASRNGFPYGGKQFLIKGGQTTLRHHNSILQRRKQTLCRPRKPRLRRRCRTAQG